MFIYWVVSILLYKSENMIGDILDLFIYMSYFGEFKYLILSKKKKGK